MKIDNDSILVAADYLDENWFEDEANILRCLVKGEGYEIKIVNHSQGRLSENEITALILMMAKTWRVKLREFTLVKGDDLILTYTLNIT